VEANTSNPLVSSVTIVEEEHGGIDKEVALIDETLIFGTPLQSEINSLIIDADVRKEASILILWWTINECALEQ
jgi:hypothetical protein